MKKTIFYSWQSDLPNNTNRGFIEEALKKAIKHLVKEDVHLEVAIDRDIKDSTGSPDIAKTLFEKIDRCQVFVADITFINKRGKRMPNPNVLLELGYAAKCVGWENIICLFNKANGKPEELPFDLRFRSPLQYSVTAEGPKAPERNLLAESLQKSLQVILDKQHSKDIIYNNIKVQVDHHLMTIANNAYKLFYGYKGFINPHDLFELLELSGDQLANLFKEKKFLGFQLFRDTDKLQTSFQAIIDNPIFAKHIDDGKVASLLTLINSLYLLNENIKNRRDLFTQTKETAGEYTVVSGQTMNPGNPPDSFMLLKNVDAEKGMVVDSGNFAKYRQAQLLSFFVVPEDQAFVLMLLYKEVFEAMENVIEHWDRSIMLNPALIE
jgi:hypothetical protein